MFPSIKMGWIFHKFLITNAFHKSYKWIFPATAIITTLFQQSHKSLSPLFCIINIILLNIRSTTISRVTKLLKFPIKKMKLRLKSTTFFSILFVSEMRITETLLLKRSKYFANTDTV